MNMKVLIITGSPHKAGTSNTLVACFMKGAEEAWHKVKIYDVARGNINPCLGCDRGGTVYMMPTCIASRRMSLAQR